MNKITLITHFASRLVLCLFYKLHSLCDTPWQTGCTTMDIMNMTPAMVVRETRQLGHYKALRRTLRGERMNATEKRDMQ